MNAKRKSVHSQRGVAPPRTRPAAIAVAVTDANGQGAQPAARQSVSSEERSQMIARIAFLRAERRGFGAGRELDDWLSAEAEVDRLLQGTPL